jgi:8-oxo-dGTP pyrophosphatase MutT (NUDIX family)
MIRRGSVNEQMSDLASISEIAHSLTHPNSRPRNAATLILVDRSGNEPKVLLGKRHLAHVFMPGHFVFPGGRIEAADRDVPAAGALHPSVQARLIRAVARPNAKTARAFALAAIRETFEETGIVIGKKHSGAVPPAPGLWANFFATGFLPDLSGLCFIARAITPPRAKRRFDARFLAVDASAIAHQAADVIHPGAELVEIVWVGLADAMRLPLPDITEVVLADLADRIAAGFAQDAPVPFYRMDRGRYVRGLL